MAQFDKVNPEKLKAFCIEAMLKAGMKKADAEITAEVLVTTDTWGTLTHGTKQLRGLLKNFRDKRMDHTASAELLSEGPGWAMYDAHIAMPMVVSHDAMKMAMAKAKEAGIGLAGVKSSGHFGAAGYYACMAAQNDMIGLCFSNVDPGVAVPGSRVPVLGTNPLAYAVPAGKEHPVFLDIATSVVAASKIYAAQALKKEIPGNWLIDKDGVPTTDPTGYPYEGAMMFMAGHKGYGIALMVEILTGVLCGGAFGSQVVSWVKEIPQPVNQSHTFIAINIGAMMPIQQFKERMDKMIREIKEAPRAKGSDRIYLPGEMEWEKRDKALKDGLSLPADVVANLKGVAEDYNIHIEEYFS
jgi:ureidoglycolate dehydrogenase (NAD+)